jgi:hypothetical protein
VEEEIEYIIILTHLAPRFNRFHNLQGFRQELIALLQPEFGISVGWVERSRIVFAGRLTAPVTAVTAKSTVVSLSQNQGSQTLSEHGLSGYDGFML